MLKNARLTSYLLSDSDELCPESSKNSAVDTARPATPVLYPPERRRRNIGHVRKQLLDRIVDYLYHQGQRIAVTSEERDAYSLALALLGSVRRLETNPFESACYQIFGSSLEVYRRRRAKAQWAQHQEFVQCIPDYDPHQVDRRQNSSMMEPYRQEAAHAQVVETGEVRRRQAEPGRLHQMPSKAQPAVQKPLRAVPRTAAAKDA